MYRAKQRASLPFVIDLPATEAAGLLPGVSLCSGQYGGAWAGPVQPP